MREDLLEEAERVLREAVNTTLPERERIQERLLELPERRRLLPGKPAPAFEAADFSGAGHSLAAYRGQTLLLHFWSGINGPSLSTMPEIAALVKENAGKEFRILSINVDPHVTPEDHERMKAAGQNYLPRLFKADDLRQMIDRHQLSWPVVWDGLGMESPLVKSYSIKNLPGLYLIGPDGLIRARNKRGDRLRAAVAQVLAEKL
ncbi:MAG: TlpA family protein disulfide reductase [Planctomycetes bacterium]|nr:TlpA family protein disulfide reductase [Planctomycetota bacterium]